MNSIIAERSLICIEPSGLQTPFIVRLGAPYKNSDGDWSCPVSLEGLELQLADMHGIDSFQALMLARSLALQLLMARANKGARFLDHEEMHNIDLNRLFDGTP